MTFRFRAIALASFAALPGMFCGAAAAQTAPDAATLESAIRSFIEKNPRVIKEALEKAELDEQLGQTRRILKERRGDLYEAGSLVMGAPDAKIAIVEFFDYNCPYCRKINPDLKAFIEQHKDVRVVLKDIATFGKDSEAVGKLVLAAGKQGKGLELHEALMAAKGKLNEASAVEAARKIGLNVDQLRKDAALAEIGERQLAARKLADTMGVTGTPLFIIGHNGIPGAPEDVMQQIAKFVQEVREKGCDVC